MKPPSIPDLRWRSGRIPALPYPPSKQIDCTAGFVSGKAKISIPGSKSVKFQGTRGRSPHQGSGPFFLESKENRSAGV